MYLAKWREDAVARVPGGVCRVSLFRLSNSQEIEIEIEIKYLKRNLKVGERVFAGSRRTGEVGWDLYWIFCS